MLIMLRNDAVDKSVESQAEFAYLYEMNMKKNPQKSLL